MERTIFVYEWNTSSNGCGLIKDWKERYLPSSFENDHVSCGLIKDWKERYLENEKLMETMGCGLIKDWKERYLDHWDSL